MATNFTVDVATGGKFECTSPVERVYLLSFSSPPDNRITTAFVDAWLLALDIIEHRYPSGVVISTSSISKFYSNGLNLEEALQTPGFFGNTLYALFRRLLTYPMPTIALVNGHAFAAGFMAAMYHDYRIMNPSRGYLCLNEVLFGAAMAAGMLSVFRQKLPNPQTYTRLVLEAKRYGGPEALQAGIVDGLGELEQALALVQERGLITMGDSGVYGRLKQEMWRESVQLLRNHDANVAWTDGVEGEADRTRDAAIRRVETWEAKAKL